MGRAGMHNTGVPVTFCTMINLNSQQVLRQAVLDHQAGRLPQAEAAYRQVLQTEPDNPDALANFGQLLAATGRLGDAEVLLSRALALRPADAGGLFALGNVQASLGRWPEAAVTFEKVLAIQPGFVEARITLGSVRCQLGREQEAERDFRQAIALRPDLDEAHRQLGTLLAERARHSGERALRREAIDVLGRAVALRPQQVDLLIELGNLWFEEGQAEGATAELRSAEECYRRALALTPNSLDAQFNLAGVLLALGRQTNDPAPLNEAQTLLQKLVSVAPGADVYTNLGLVLLGLARRQGDDDGLQAAERLLRQALAYRPDLPEALRGLAEVLYESVRLAGKPGAFLEAESTARTLTARRADVASWLLLANILLESGSRINDQNRLQEAGQLYNQVLTRDPESVTALLNLSRVQFELGQRQGAAALLREAEDLQRRVLSRRPEMAVAHNNLSVILTRLGRADAAVAACDEALRLQPTLAEAGVQRARLHLMRGELAAGWLQYEQRWRVEGMAPPNFAQPTWSGESLAGRTILIHVEQGAGDAMMCIRYAALLKRTAARVLVACRPEEGRLFQTCAGVDGVVTSLDELATVSFDVQVPVMSLPGLCGTVDAAAIPAAVPYLQAPPASRLPAVLQQRFAGASGRRIGCVWAPKLRFAEDYLRWCPLGQFAPLFELPGISWFSLYKGEQVGELQSFADRVVDLGSHFADFADTAWAVDKLDLVITVDTSVAHLAGALGKSVWILLPFAADWRWLTDRDDSPWYPTARLFRQRTFGDWSGVIARVGAALRG